MALVNSGGICYAGEKPSALARNRARPGGKGIGRDFRGARDIFGAAPRHLGDWAPVRRIFNFVSIGSDKGNYRK